MPELEKRDGVVSEQGLPRRQAAAPRTSGGSGPISLKSMLDDYERQIIRSALAGTAGNQRRAAAALGLLPTTLHEKMKRLGLLRPREPGQGADELN